MNYFVSVFTCILSTPLLGMQKVAHSETLMPGGKSVITSYLHILPKDVEELVAQLLIHAHPALFPPISRVLSGHTGLISSIALTPDGKWALTGSEDGTARFWDLGNPTASPRVLSGHTGTIYSVALTPDGKWALTGSDDKTVRLWDLLNPGSSPRVLSGHTDWIRSVAVTPDGKWALTGSQDNTARLWDLSNPGSSPRVLSGHTGRNILSSSDTRWQVGFNWI